MRGRDLTKRTLRAITTAVLIGCCVGAGYAIHDLAQPARTTHPGRPAPTEHHQLEPANRYVKA